MANPRKVFNYNRIDSAYTTYPGDASIVPPALGANGFVPGMSAQVGLAVTNTATGTGTPQVGLGAAGGRLEGKVIVVETDGAVGVQHRGYMYLPFVTGANQPVPNQPVAVDGAGNVQLATVFTGAICEGFDLNPEPVQTGSVPTLYCIVRKY